MNRVTSGTPLRPILLCGFLLLLGYVGLFAVLQSPVLWYALRPDPIRSISPDIFRPVNALFPNSWVNLERTHPLALLVVPLFVVVLALVTVPLVYLLRRLTKPSPEPALTVRHAPRMLISVFALTVAIMLVLLVTRGLLSTDIYSYTWYSRILAVHGASPMTHAPAEFPPDPEGAFYWIGWPDEPSVYGPVWVIISTLFFQAGNSLGGTFSAQVLALRLLADLAHLVNAWLVWSIGGLLFERTLRLRPRRHPLRHPRSAPMRHAQLRGPSYSVPSSRVRDDALGLRTAALLIYIWSPLLLIEFAGSGHNDVLMITFVLLAVWLHLKGLWPLAASALALGVLVKLPALLLVPGYLWYLFRRGILAFPNGAWLRRAAKALARPALALAVMVATAVLLYFPFWEGVRTLLPAVSGPANRLYLHSLAYDIWWNGPQITVDLFQAPTDRAAFMESVRQFLDATLRPLFTGMLGILAIALTWGVRTFRGLLVSWGWLMLAAAITQGWFWPWYVSWSVALAAVAGSARLRTATLVFSISALLLYVEEQVLAQHFRVFLDWSGVFIVLPPLLYILYSWLTSRRRARSSTLIPGAQRSPARVTSPASK